MLIDGDRGDVHLGVATHHHEGHSGVDAGYRIDHLADGGDDDHSFRIGRPEVLEGA